MTGHVAVVGSINIDITSFLERWPRIGETVAARESQITLGGKGANQAIAARRLGVEVSMVGAVGIDPLGHMAQRCLGANDLMACLMEDERHATGTAAIDVGPDGRNINRIAAGANAALTSDFIAKNADAIRTSGVLLLQNEVPVEVSMEAAAIARASGSLVVMDPAPVPAPFWNSEVLAAFDVVTPNAEEVGAITGTVPATLDDALSATRHLIETGMRGVVVTMGELGVAWSVSGSSGMRPAPLVHAIDTVAAGDCFNGAMAAALTQGDAWPDAIDVALHAAALATTRKGAADSAPRASELDAFVLARSSSAHRSFKHGASKPGLEQAKG
ncbi:MAG: ribokinase [Pseudomonadota bacterium]